MTRRLLVILLAILVPAVASAQTETVEYYALDAIGSVRVVFDANGNVLTRMDYTPFGAEVSSASGLPARRFADLHRDPEAGLDYAQARSYQVRTGRLTAPDPVYGALDDPQRWNRYAYALNAPLMYTDVSGLCPQPAVTNTSSGVGVCVPFGTYTLPEFAFMGRRPRIIAETIQRPGERGGQTPTVPDGGGDGDGGAGGAGGGGGGGAGGGDGGGGGGRDDRTKLGAFVTGCREGAAIVADAAIPFGDPFYAAQFYGEATPGRELSRMVADISIGLLLSAGNIRGLAELTRGAKRGTTAYRIGNNPRFRVGYAPWPQTQGRVPRISWGADRATKIHWDLRICGR